MNQPTKPGLTDSQRQAVELEATPLVVRAGAGSGKTRVLVDRYLRLVLGSRQLSPRRILAATFTEKAAAEMKERAASELTKANRPELVAELNTAPISTLHGFCARLITQHALRLGLDPSYRVLDEHQATLLQEEVLSGILAHWRAEYPEGLKAIVSHLHWPGERKTRSGRPPSSRGFSRQFLDMVAAVRSAGKADSPPFVALEDTDVQTRRTAQRLLGELREILSGMGSGRSSQDKARLAISCLERYLSQDDPYHLELPEVVRQMAKISLQTTKEIKAVLVTLRGEVCPAILDSYHQPRYELVRTELNRLFGDFLSTYRAEKLRLGKL